MQEVKKMSKLLADVLQGGHYAFLEELPQREITTNFLETNKSEN